MSEYAQRDHEALGELYQRHVLAMTVERLHYKSDIAAELAYRDGVIAELRRGGWISVKDRLPEPCKRQYEHDTVMVWSTYPNRGEQRAREGYYIHELKQWRIGMENGASTVTHWQPLPAPPAQQSEERKG